MLVLAAKKNLPSLMMNRDASEHNSGQPPLTPCSFERRDLPINKNRPNSPYPESSPHTIVLVTRDKKLKRSLKQLFDSEGYSTELYGDALSGFGFCRSHYQYLVLVDLLLPHKSGYDLCRRLLRMNDKCPIIVIGPKSDLANKILLLELGVCDYVSTPFNPRELLARVRVALRWSNRVRGDQVFSFADVTVDVPKMEVRRGGKPVLLRKREFDMLKFMIVNQQRVIPRREFLEKIWDYRDGVSIRAVDQQMLKIRQKLENDPAAPLHFRTVHSIGYKFVP
jgi:DNA-binding response OmpR family regulator